MKKRLFVMFVVLAVMSIFTSTVFAAPTDSKHVSLVSVQYQAGGIVLLFETSGLTKSDLKDNSFYADSNSQKMSCNFVDDTTRVRCTVSKALAGEGGFQVTLAGFGFWGELPEARIITASCGEGEEPWYTFNAYVYGEYDGSGEIPVQIWDLFEETGFFDMLASELGVTLEITGTFCGEYIGMPPL